MSSERHDIPRWAQIVFWTYFSLSLFFTSLSLLSPLISYRNLPLSFRNRYFTRFQTLISEFQGMTNQWLFSPEPPPFIEGTICSTREKLEVGSSFEDCHADFADKICGAHLFSSYKGALSAQLSPTIPWSSREYRIMEVLFLNSHQFAFSNEFLNYWKPRNGENTYFLSHTLELTADPDKTECLRTRVELGPSL